MIIRLLLQIILLIRVQYVNIKIRVGIQSYTLSLHQSSNNFEEHVCQNHLKNCKVKRLAVEQI